VINETLIKEHQINGPIVVSGDNKSFNCFGLMKIKQLSDIYESVKFDGLKTGVFYVKFKTFEDFNTAWHFGLSHELSRIDFDSDGVKSSGSCLINEINDMTERDALGNIIYFGNAVIILSGAIEYE